MKRSTGCPLIQYPGSDQRPRGIQQRHRGPASAPGVRGIHWGHQGSGQGPRVQTTHHPPPSHPPPHTHTHAHHAQCTTTCNTRTHVEGLNCMTNPRRTNSTRRNKLRARVLREETICWLCGEAVNTSLQAGLPQSPEVDELLPVSLGGDPYDRSNVRLAHRLCNQKRSNKLPKEAIEAAKARLSAQKPLRKSREW